MNTDSLTPEQAAHWREADRILDALLELAPDQRAAALDAWDCPEPVRQCARRLLSQADNPTAALESALALLASPPTLNPMRMVGRRAGRWCLDEVIGVGGMSVVHAAHDAAQPERRVAIKLMSASLIGHPGPDRLQREQRALARLNHPHIVPLIEAGLLDDGTPWLAMGLVEGTRIDLWCFERALDIADRVRLMIDVADAVAHAHRALIVHRDLKPANVLVDASGEVRLLDFGIAGLIEPNAERTVTQQHALTPEYAAPEQFEGAAPATAMDVYGLGALLYRLLTGKAPRRQRPGDTQTDTPSLSIVEAAYADSSQRARARSALRGDLDAVLLKALEQEPERRYAGAAEFASDLRAWLEARPVAAQRPTLRYRIVKLMRRHRGAVSLAVAALLGILPALGVALWQAQRAAESARLAELRATDAARESARATAVSDFLVDLFGAAAAGTPANELPSTIDLLAIAERRIGDSFDADPRIAGRLLVVMGEVNQSLGRLAEAQALLEQARARLEAAPDANALDRTRISIELAWVHLRAGRYPQAMQEIATGKSLIGTLDSIDPQTREAMVDIEVSALMNTGRAADAVEVAARHYAEVKADPSPSPQIVAGAAYNVGLARTAAGDDVGALEALREADAAANGLARQWELRLSIGNALATALNGAGLWSEALARRERDLDVLRSSYPAGHARIGQALNNLASDYNRIGRVVDAIALIEEAMPMLKANGRDGHPSVAAAYNNRGSALVQMARHQEALAEYAQAMARIAPLSTPTDRRLLTLLLNEATALARLGRSTEAMERIARIEAAGPSVPALVLEGSHLIAAEALLRHGDAAGAAARARAVFEVVPSTASARRAHASIVLAEALQRLGDADGAGTALNEADIELDRLGAQIDTTALHAIRERHRVSRTLIGAEEAARLLRAERARIAALLGADDPRVKSLDAFARGQGVAID